VPPSVEGNWNHNIHVTLRLIEEVVPAGGRALDVGCGEGWLCREMQRRGAVEVVGVDPDRGSLESAAAAPGAQPGLLYVQGSLLALPLGPARFDLVACSAALHHLADLPTALRALARMTAPGGALAVIGLARSRRAGDYGADVAGVVATQALRLRHGRAPWETPAPKVWPPPHTYEEVERVSAGVLPGRRYRRHAMFRYTIMWRRPAE
jgi:2-polyprenyl-3-methyl-5-hydroxy-6-metoxy-1,4-benzoquinol methylase